MHKRLLEFCHNGVLNDRLLIAGSDDPLLQLVVEKITQKLGRSKPKASNWVVITLAAPISKCGVPIKTLSIAG